MKFQALKLLMEKNDSLATEKAETRARKLQKEMIRLMDQITAAGLREQKNANMVLAGQQWIKNVLRQRNSEQEAEQLIEAAMVRNEIDPERIQFLNANGPLAHSSQGEVHLVEFGGDECAAKVISTAGMTPPEQTKLLQEFPD